MKTPKQISIIPNESFRFAGETKARVHAGATYAATPATNQPNWKAEGKVFVGELLLTKADYVLAPVESITVQFEYTDTSGGEANYSWVRRSEEQFPADITDRALVRRAKAWAGLTGVRCTVSNMGDLIDIRPRGSCTVLFVSTIY